MTKIEKIYNLLEKLHTSLFEKHQAQSVKRGNAREKKLKSANDIALAHEYTKGQLYEIGYIQEKFWEIMSENNN